MALLEVLSHLHQRGARIIEKGAPVGRIQNEVPVWPRLLRARASVANNDLGALDGLRAQMDEALDRIEADYDVAASAEIGAANER